MDSVGKADKEIILSVQVRVEDMRLCFNSLVESFKKRGVEEEVAESFLNDHIYATCDQCGIPVSGSDFIQVAKIGTHLDPDNPKVTRLVQGFCARKSCESYFYKLHFMETEYVDWTRIWATTQELMEADLSSRPNRAGGPSTWHQLLDLVGPRNLLALSVGVLAVGLAAYFHFRTPSYSTNPSGYTIGKPEEVYTIDPVFIDPK